MTKEKALLSNDLIRTAVGFVEYEATIADERKRAEIETDGITKPVEKPESGLLELEIIEMIPLVAENTHGMIFVTLNTVSNKTEVHLVFGGTDDDIDKKEDLLIQQVKFLLKNSVPLVNPPVRLPIKAGVEPISGIRIHEGGLKNFNRISEQVDHYLADVLNRYKDVSLFIHGYSLGTYISKQAGLYYVDHLRSKLRNRQDSVRVIDVASPKLGNFALGKALEKKMRLDTISTYWDLITNMPVFQYVKIGTETFIGNNKPTDLLDDMFGPHYIPSYVKAARGLPRQ